MSSKKELRQLQRVAEAQGKLFADERIKTERLMAEEKRKEIRKVLWSLSLDLDRDYNLISGATSGRGTGKDICG